MQKAAAAAARGPVTRQRRTTVENGDGPRERKKPRKENVTCKFQFGGKIKTKGITIPTRMDAAIDAAKELFVQLKCIRFSIQYTDEEK